MVPGVLNFIRVGSDWGRGRTTKLQGGRLYHEEQGFGWPWPGMLMVFVGVASALAVIAPLSRGLWQQLVLGRPWGDKPLPNAALLAIVPVFTVLLSLLPLGILFAPLRVEVHTDGLKLELTRVKRTRVILRREVRRAELTRIGPVGWGCSHLGRSVIYRMAGSEGVLIELSSGKKIVVGSEYPRRLLDAVRSMQNPEPRR